MVYLPNGVERILVPQEEIDQIVTRIAEQVDRDYHTDFHSGTAFCPASPVSLTILLFSDDGIITPMEASVNHVVIDNRRKSR